MIEKRLGKIDFVEFGSMKDYPFQLGLQLGFSMSGSGVMDGGKIHCKHVSRLPLGNWNSSYQSCGIPRPRGKNPQ